MRRPAARRPRLLIAGEMGANLGHASKMVEVARALEGRAEVFLASADPAALRALAPGLGARLLPAPAPRAERSAASAQGALGFPGALLASGWRDASALSATAEAWRGLLELARPDALAAQAAPGALLAARALGLPALIYGSGFDAPPRASPMPMFETPEAAGGAAGPVAAPGPARASHAAAQEAAALASANAALRRLGAAPLAAFADLLRPEGAALATFAEVDPYAPRARLEPGHPPYLGQITTLGEGAEAAWRPGARRRVLAYLRPEAPAFGAIVEGLAALGPRADVIVAAPGAAGAGERGPVRIFAAPLRLDGLLEGADLGVSHGSNGVAAAFVLAGAPQVAIPTQAEQMMIARVLAARGLALGIAGRIEPKAVSEAASRALASDRLAGTARAVAARLAHEAQGRPSPARAVADQLLALAGAG